MKTEVSQYLAEINRIYKADNATEHTYRPALKSLLEKATIGLTVTNEPKRIACGAPDYIVTRGEIPVGYIEAKDVGTDLNDRLHKEQFDRYRRSLNNLIITDYLTFQLFENGELITSVTIGKKENKNITAIPENFEAFATMIRLFAGYSGQSIYTSEQLSKVMATKARLMANILEKALNETDSSEDNTLEGQLNGFREVLIPNITHKEFSDIYAQTIAYGMFAAKLNDASPNPSEGGELTPTPLGRAGEGLFTRKKAAELIPHSNPFLRKLFQYIAGYDLDGRIRWVVDDLADLYNHVNVNDIKNEFGKNFHDPIIHFYETFLAQYDPALRKSRGVWYTPQPVVQFIVQAVDDILKQEFSLPQGLADASKVQNNGNTKEYHRVQILDPATGTGTFLAEVVQNIYQRFKNQQGMWQNYATKHLLPRINGFEILMASYAMAHLKIDMLLKQTGYTHPSGGEGWADRLHIYLTNSLDEARAKTEIPFARWLSDEANAASRIKQDVPVMVVLGNPPYSISTQNKGKWINDLLNVYKQGLNERNIQPLSDDYIKFIRYGQYFVEKNGGGILAYISNNSFIDGLIHRQMRKNLLHTFDKIYILDLHGNAKKKETAPDGSKDENVFDIQQGVSINIFVKTGRDAASHRLPRADGVSKTPAEVYHYDIYGKRTEKYSFLLNNNLKTIQWQQIKYFNHNCFFVPKDFELKEEYEKGFVISELFPVNSCGVKTHDDANLINFIPFAKNNQPYAYRPFDIRYINYDLKKVQRHRYRVMKHFDNCENIGLLTCRQQSSFDFQHIFVSNFITDICAVSLQTRETTYVLPLYLYPDTDQLIKNDKRKPNLNAIIITEISQRLGLQFTDEKEPHPSEGAGGGFFAPIDILDYIYAVLHSPAYRERYKEFLKIDFPRVPYPENTEKFWKLVELGKKLRRLHLLESVEPQEGMADYPVAGSDIVEKPQYSPPSEGAGGGKVFINDTQYFDHVPTEAWNFYIGGYQPAQKWLKDRKGRKLEYEDIVHYQRMIRVLKETEEMMNKIEFKQSI